MNIDITGLDRAEVLAALYNASKPLGLGILHYRPEPMTAAEAKELLMQHHYFDYLMGRVMKIDMAENPLRVDLYDRDNGSGAAAEVISKLFKTFQE